MIFSNSIYYQYQYPSQIQNSQLNSSKDCKRKETRFTKKWRIDKFTSTSLWNLTAYCFFFWIILFEKDCRKYNFARWFHDVRFPENMCSRLFLLLSSAVRFVAVIGLGGDADATINKRPTTGLISIFWFPISKIAQLAAHNSGHKYGSLVTGSMTWNLDGFRKKIRLFL